MNESGETNRKACGGCRNLTDSEETASDGTPVCNALCGVTYEEFAKEQQQQAA